MCRRILLVAIIASLTPVAFGHAETAPAKVDPLKKLLEEKYTPPPTQKPTTFDKRDYHPIAPKQNSPQQPNSGQPGRGGQLAPASDFSVAVASSAADAAPRSLLFRVADNRADNGLLTLTSNVTNQPNARVRPLPSPESFVVAQQGRPPVRARHRQCLPRPAQADGHRAADQLHVEQI